MPSTVVLNNNECIDKCSCYYVKIQNTAYANDRKIMSSRSEMTDILNSFRFQKASWDIAIKGDEFKTLSLASYVQLEALTKIIITVVKGYHEILAKMAGGHSWPVL